ncbi:hypothetical protein [Limibacterium fermenti]|jgi:hypothetical protein|uniref:hypothetical protein n=1 Tax=Limibacterium fermenti TaxID=3229863 RepID=UPI000E9E962B|nr:hypothetical protein [Porphyromonadaceae bacterium]HBK32364.1 hypothetical protein [Porphyromonadaceae bacterium]HBX21625.1 hypothetical protein [Porphyromonadaceae bacterium]HBX46150.1 hypothetical protein [Porphyromonadaceae bacterium]HCM22225.1 hypothetical protein [Porphyromonadaceae bacterium]
MNELEIRYSISKKLKAASLLCGVYLLCISAGVSIFQVIAKDYSFFFFAGIAGIVIAAIMILSVTLWQSKPLIVIDNDSFRLHLPKQRIDGAIEWEKVTYLGIGLSYLTMTTSDSKNFKIDLENLKYIDLRNIKTKLIEICEAKNIPYGNL